jgi:DNA-directed RNA polymerase subunit A'
MQKKPVKKQVKSLQFTLFDPEEIKKISKAKIITPELYDVDGYPVDGGLMDLRLGAIDPGVRCRTCGGRLKECLGHPGSIELARPILHIKYVPVIELFLRCYCSECHKLMIKEKDLTKYRNVKDRLKRAKDSKKCPYCQQEQEKIKLEKPTTFKIGKRRIFPSEIRDRLVRIPDEEVKLAGMDPKIFRPEWAILTLLLVPPVTVRPSITLESGERSEDDLTHKLSDIIRANQRLWENLNAGAPEVIIEDLWDLLQYHVTTFFDNSIAKIPPARHRSGQPLKTITERIKGKEGRIRHNLAGKRVNFSSRTVISPDPALRLNEVGVPFEIAEILTVNEKVTSANIEKLKKVITHEGYPTANYIIRPDGRRKRITPDLIQEILEELEPGYVVERQLIDGDVVLFNRHPSLHKASLMAHFVKVLPYKTFRLHPATAPPYNADFDGDEMNIHVPQTEEARAEAKILMDVNANLISCKDNSNALGCIADAVTGNFLLSDQELSKADAMQLLYQSGMNDFKVSKNRVYGKEVLSELFPKIDFKGKNKTGDVFSIKGGKIESGVLDENIIGEGGGELLKILDNEVGRTKTIDILDDAFDIGTNYLTRHGFTISVNDLNVNQKVKDNTARIIQEAEEETQKIINAYKDNSLEIIPGKTAEETREIKILQTLNGIRTKIGKIVSKEVSKSNPVSIMMNSGAGGNVLNITQMACCVGQQALWAKRINIGFSNRTLSFFKQGDLAPRARGFIYNSFLKGLEPYEFFFGAITGRDALMDTALRTPKSGYLYRRLANALQDIRVEYDHTVRDGSGNIVQFQYGEDGLDVCELHRNKKISPGEAIGIVTAQSFGEPSTQMALNVFHFAGVQEMQVTQGLPRLIEIFDARRTPSTPAMEIHLMKSHDNEKDARVIAEKIQEVKFKDIIKEIKINFANKRIEALVDNDALRRVHATIDTVAKRLKEKKAGKHCKVNGNTIVFTEKDMNFKEIYKLKEKIKDTIISGVKGIEQVLVVKRDEGFVILTAGTNLKEMLKFKGVDPDRTISNDIHEVAEILGIEVARATIIREVDKVINAQGLDIDKRHSLLIADAMTSTGTVRGITRMGIISQKSSILARASFETPIKQFVNATLKDNKDELNSVIENIILNQPVPVGTGLPGLMVEVTGPLTDDKPKKDKSVEYLTKETKDTSSKSKAPIEEKKK